MSYMGYDSTDSPYEGLDDCPRCGGEADVMLWSPPFSNEQGRYYFAYCTQCRLMTYPYCRSVQEAKLRWNKVQSVEGEEI